MRLCKHALGLLHPTGADQCCPQLPPLVVREFFLSSFSVAGRAAGAGGYPIGLRPPGPPRGRPPRLPLARDPHHARGPRGAASSTAIIAYLGRASAHRRSRPATRLTSLCFIGLPTERESNGHRNAARGLRRLASRRSVRGLCPSIRQPSSGISASPPPQHHHPRHT